MFKLLVCNCRGAGNYHFLQALLQYMKIHKPSIVVILELKISGLSTDTVIKKIGLPYSHQVEAIGLKGGI